jgi:transcriptional regulator with XRE-family HTH domain
MSLRDDREEVDRMMAKIVELARRRGHTAETLEEAAGLAQNRISKWKDRTKQRSEPSARQLWKIAKVLGTKIDYFLEDNSDDALAFADEMDHVIWVARKLGPEEALRRLLNDPGRAAPVVNGSGPGRR